MATKKGESLFTISNDPKVLEVISEFGPVGYGVVMKLEEFIHNSPEGLLRDNPMTFNKIAVELSADIGEVLNVIAALKKSHYINKIEDNITVRRALEEVKKDNEIRKKRGKTGGGRPPKPKPVYTEDFDSQYKRFVTSINKKFDKNYRGDAKSKASFHARIQDGYTSKDFKFALEAVFQDKYHQETNPKFKYATPEFFTRASKIDTLVNQGMSLEKEKKDGVIELGQSLSDGGTED